MLPAASKNLIGSPQSYGDSQINRNEFKMYEIAKTMHKLLEKQYYN